MMRLLNSPGLRCVALLLLALTSAGVFSQMQPVQVEGDCTPTPVNFTSLFLNSCMDILSRNTFCMQAWNLFSSAFAGVSANQVTPQSYMDYFTVNPLIISPPPNTSLFWSQTPELVNMLSSMSTMVASSASEPSTAILNNVESNLSQPLRWCGIPDGAGGIRYNGTCPCSVSADFFVLFSELFARAARGTMFFLGYGEREGGTFSGTSFFARYEIPNLNSSQVTGAVVMIVHREGQGESCGEGTVVNLENALRNQLPNVTYECFDLIGDPMNSTQVEGLVNCSASIITSVQNGMTPEMMCPNGSSQGVQPVSVVVAVLTVLGCLLAL